MAIYARIDLGFGAANGDGAGAANGDGAGAASGHGRVAEPPIELDEPPMQAPPALVWVEAGPEVREGWLYDGEAFSPPPSPPPQPEASWTVPKLAVIERLGAAGLLRAVRQALKLGVPDAELSDAELLLRDRWTAAGAIASGDAEIRAVLARAGADPDMILAAAGA